MASLVQVALVAAIVLQVFAAAQAARALPHSGPYRFLWIGLTAALVLMVTRRIAALFAVEPAPLGEALLALTISTLLAFSMSGLTRMLMASRTTQRELTRLATTDALTGVSSRRHLLAELDKALQRAARNRQPVSVLMLDIDHFKAINDRHGHAIGDQVLVTIAARCRERLRVVDVFGRVGGEEFVAVLPETDAAGALITAERLLSDIGDSAVPTQGGAIAVTVSIGAATHDPRTPLPDAPPGIGIAEALLQRADAALYRAKAAGRNNVQGEVTLPPAPAERASA